MHNSLSLRTSLGPFDPERFENLWERVNRFMGDNEQFCCFHTVGAHPDYAIPVKVYTDTA